MRALAGTSFRRALKIAGTLLSVICAVGAIILYQQALAIRVPGSDNILWFTPLLVTAGFAAGWQFSYQFRRNRLKQRRALGKVDSAMARYRNVVVDSEVSGQLWKEAELRRQSEQTERDRLNHAINYMKS